MRKLPYCQGSWFAVPLEGGGFGLGVVARVAPRGGIILAYFLGPKREAIPKLAQVAELKARDAVLAIRVSDLGLIRRTWPIIGQARSWQQAEWPMPVFVRHEGSKAWLVYYADDNPNRRVAEEPAPLQINDVGRDSLYGFGAAEVVMTKVLTDDSNRAQPAGTLIRPEAEELGRNVSQTFKEEVLQQLRSMGANTNLPHGLDLYLYLPTEAAARVAAEKVRRLHFETQIVPGAKEGTWLCKARIKIIPDSAPLDGIGAYFEQLAFELHGDFDGWEAGGVSTQGHV